MSRRASLLLRASVIWTAWVWIVLVRNMVVGHFSWSFKAIHILLAIVSLAFAVVVWQITTTSRRFTREVERERNARQDRMSNTQLAVGVARLGWRKRFGAGKTAAPQTAPLPSSVPGDASE
ncbi:MAG: hypothetical protein ABSH30_14675 [Acidimicrobiales bacterium]|jgi:hypothetical protein